MELSPIRASYLAGAIDGEGSIQIGASKRTPTARPCHHARVTIVNTKRSWLETLASWAGGAIYAVGAPHSRATRRQCYRLEWRSAEAREVLPIVRPYLLIKGAQADIVLEYFDLAAKRRACNLPGRTCDPSIIERIEELRAQIKVLNMRGTVAPAPRPVPLDRMCGISKCGRRLYSNGYCRKHYRKYIVSKGPTWHEVNCEWCSKPFVAKRKDARFCSKRCCKIASRLSSPAVSEATVQSQDVGDGS